MCEVEASLGTETHVAHENLLCGFEVPLDLTVHRVDDNDAIIREDVEHVSHTEAWEEQTQHGHAPQQPGPRQGHMQHGAHKTRADWMQLVRTKKKKMQFLAGVEVGMSSQLETPCLMVDGERGESAPKAPINKAHPQLCSTLLPRLCSQTSRAVLHHLGLVTNTSFQ